ncbi:MAG: GNAT family N-acetyltransferase [Dehalococcoidia bacterium]|nr:GNAT family N-acetyltransferase [Dehalococcoidia bacterium]
MTACIIRKVQDGDRSAVVEIFNYFVEHSFAAYPDKKAGDGFFDILKGICRSGVFYVIEAPGSGVIGFGLLRSHQPTEAFNRSSELTYFILPGYNRQGWGTRLLKVIEDDARSLGIGTLLANISSLNEQSLNFHAKNGFVECGRFKHIGRKFGQDFDVIWMQKFL